MTETSEMLDKGQNLRSKPRDRRVVLHVLGIQRELGIVQGVQGLPLPQLRDEPLQVLSGMKVRLN